MDLLVDSSQLIQLRKVTTTDLIIGEGAYGRVIKLRVHGTVCAWEMQFSTDFLMNATNFYFLCLATMPVRSFEPDILSLSYY